MTRIQVFKHNSDIQLGKGDGVVNKKNNTAAITSWKKKYRAALTPNKPYKLKASSTIYPDANCTGIAEESPVATFDNVV